jgi:hypothetical protein
MAILTVPPEPSSFASIFSRRSRMRFISRFNLLSIYKIKDIILYIKEKEANTNNLLFVYSVVDTSCNLKMMWRQGEAGGGRSRSIYSLAAQTGPLKTRILPERIGSMYAANIKVRTIIYRM